MPTGWPRRSRSRGEKRTVVAVVGDGALTGGMCWEALNNIAAAKDRSVVIVVNDNGRSYSPTIGGLAEHLTDAAHEPALREGAREGQETSSVARRSSAIRCLRRAARHQARAQGCRLRRRDLFEDLGLKYVGPIDGHDIAAVESRAARALASSAAR